MSGIERDNAALVIWRNNGRTIFGDGMSDGLLEGAYMREVAAVKAEADSGPHNRKGRRAAEAKERSRRPPKKRRY